MPIKHQATTRLEAIIIDKYPIKLFFGNFPLIEGDVFKGRSIPQPSWAQKGLFFGASLVFLTLLMSLAIGYWGETAFVVSVGLIVGIALILISLMYERFPLYLLAVSLSLSDLLRISYIPSTLLVIPGGLAVISLLAAVAFRKTKLYFQSPAFIMAILLGIWASIATTYVGSVSESRPYWLVIILLLLVPNLLTQKEHLLRVGWLFLLPLGALGVYIFIYQLSAYFSTPNISATSLHLVTFEVGDKNIVGMWLTLGLPFAYYLYLHYKNEPVKRMWLVLAGGAMLAGSLATLSLGVVVGLCVLIAAAIWLQPDMRTRLRSLAFGLLLIPLVFNGFVLNRLQNQQLLSADTSWGSNRGELWYAGAQTIRDYPIFGIGLNPVNRIAMMKYISSGFIWGWYYQGVMVLPHNVFLSVGIDIGLPGLALYVLLLGFIFYLLWKLKRKLARSPGPAELMVFTNILIVALLIGWVQGMALSVHLDKLLWFLMGTVIALWQIANQKSDLISADHL